MALASRIDTATPEELPALEEAIRIAWRSSYVDGSEPAPAGLLSFHPSGYVREDAVKALANARDGGELRFLLLRLNDWVEPVRARAYAAVLDRLRHEYAALFAESFVLVVRAARGQRIDGAALLERLARLFASDAARGRVLALVQRGPGRTARALVRFLLDRVPSLHAELIATAASSDDALVRVWITAAVKDMATLQRLTRDPSPAVRRAALIALPAADAAPHLERAVLDRSGAVREIARHLLGKRDVAAAYRDALPAAATPRKLTTAIAGLAETGTAADAELIAPYLSHGAPSVRRTAVKAVMRLAGDRFADRIAAMLNDPAPSVSAAARNAVRKHAPALDAAQLMGLAASQARHVRLNALHAIAALPKWQSIAPLLRAAADPDEEVAAVAERYVEAWNRNFNRTQAMPTKREAEDVRAALAAGRDALNPRTVDEIAFAVRSLSPRGTPS